MRGGGGHRGGFPGAPGLQGAAREAAGDPGPAEEVESVLDTGGAAAEGRGREEGQGA